MKYSTALIILLFSALNSFSQNPDVDQKVDSVLALMTLEEKVGQMAQVERGALGNINDISYYSLGSLLSGGGSSPTPNTPQSWADMYDSYQEVALQSRLGIPIIYGVDAVHGHNNVIGAVIFPHNIGLGCTWNTDLVTTINQITAKEVAATGIDWTFSPCIAVPQNERWGRTYEGFGETSEIQKMMASASVNGLQGEYLSTGETILACAKHFVGDGGTTNGIDQGNTQISEEVLRDLHMEGYIDAIAANVGSIMASYNSWNGQKLHGHTYLLNDVLKEELGFEGFIVSDWKGVDQVDEDYREAVKRSINAGIDMVMVPDRYIYFINILQSLVEDNEVSIDRIDDAVRRILKQKFLLNLFEEPFTDQSLLEAVGSEAHRSIAKQAVRESMVLLNAKNGILPLSKNGQKILVAGELAKDLGAQCGGWSISWMGSNGNITEGTNIFEGFQNLTETSEIIYSHSGNYSGTVDVAVVVIGEDPYAEGAGDRTSLKLEQEDIILIKSIKETGIPVIALLISGRPMIIGDILPYTDAIIAAWLPGTEGEGIAEILYGDFLPKGKLTNTWPRTMNQIPINFGDEEYNPLFKYKHGLQFFPNPANSETLLPYAAVTGIQGNKIILALTDNITSLSYELSDFEIKINNTTIPNNVTSIEISETDQSVLFIGLNNTIMQSDDNISITYTGNGIYASELQLEPFSDYFVYNDISGYGGLATIPGKIEAEDYLNMFGIQTEPCTDVGGGLNVGYIDPGDWIEYNVNVTTTGRYELSSRISGYAPGILSFVLDGVNVANVNYTSTNGWQNWQSFTTELNMEEGEYILKVVANSDAFNINHFTFDVLNDNTPEFANIFDIQTYPNPVLSDFKLVFASLMPTSISIKLYDMSGIQIQPLYAGSITSGLNTFNFKLNSDIPAGLYFIELKDNSRRYFYKIIKN